MSVPARVLIAGATSAIAIEVARRFAAEGAAFVLAGRDPARLESVARDLRVRGAASCQNVVADFSEQRSVDLVVEAAGPQIDAALLAWGTLPDQRAIEGDPGAIERALRVNAVSIVTMAAAIAPRISRGGCLAAIGSVAGDRGRRGNYVYGGAKAAIDVFMEGLRARLEPEGIRVLTVKPGWVDTPMTAGVRKNALFASPEAVGAVIHEGMKRGDGVIYAPGYWRWIMLVIRSMPGSLLRRLGI